MTVKQNVYIFECFVADLLFKNVIFVAFFCCCVITIMFEMSQVANDWSFPFGSQFFLIRGKSNVSTENFLEQNISSSNEMKIVITF